MFKEEVDRLRKDMHEKVHSITAGVVMVNHNAMSGTSTMKIGNNDSMVFGNTGN